MTSAGIKIGRVYQLLAETLIKSSEQIHQSYSSGLSKSSSWQQGCGQEWGNDGGNNTILGLWWLKWLKLRVTGFLIGRLGSTIVESLSKAF